MNDCPRHYTQKKAAYRSVSPGLRKKPLRRVFAFGGAERSMTVHDTIPKRKRLIGQFHLIYVKTRFGGFLLLEGQKDE
ncbi:hypothetical protein [Escherichia coli]|uniref:hypothetical protein n=1 Tax=Escherichia coli TaxID=562 RepID=UPI0011DD551B|nr:hypothetical protein [Escherichia coli]